MKRRGHALRKRYGRADSFGVEPVPADVRARALDFATRVYRRHREFKLGPKAAYRKTWNALQRAAYGIRSEIGFISYAHQIGEIVAEAQSIVDASGSRARRTG